MSPGLRSTDSFTVIIRSTQETNTSFFKLINFYSFSFGCALAFSACGEQRPLSSCGAPASDLHGFSGHGAGLQGTRV